MAGRDARRRPPLALGLVALAMLCALSGCGALAAVASPSPDQGALLVEIDYVNTGGQPTPTPITPRPVPPTLVPQRFAPINVRVAVVRPGDPKRIVAEQVTSSGTAAFRLPAGRYWVLLPRENQPYLSDQLGDLFEYLPDKTGVFAWREVVVPPGGTAQATLTVTHQGA